MPCSVSNTNHSTRAGKRSTRPFLSEKEAKLTALRVLKERSLSPLAFQTVNVLITTGVLTTKQLQSILNISIRSLKRYHYQHLLNHLYAPDTLTEFSFPHAYTNRLRLYTLGTLGIAIADAKGNLVPSHAGYSSHQITHDVLCNQVALNLIQYGKTLGYTPHGTANMKRVSMVKKPEKSLKMERVHHVRYQTRGKAMTDIFYYIESFYNRRRRHSSLGYLSPLAYETSYHEQAAAMDHCLTPLN